MRSLACSRRSSLAGPMALLLALAVGAVGCAPGAPLAPAELAVRDAWIRPAKAGQTTAAYLVVAGGPEDDRLMGAALAGAERVEVHETVLEGDMVRMVPRPEGLAVPAGGQLELAPRGAHLMVIGLTEELVEGQTVPLVLTFEQAGQRTVTAAVQLGP